MEEKENSNEKLIETVNITNKVRNNIKSPEQILEKCGGVCLNCYKKAKAEKKAAQTENKDFEVIE